MNENGLNYIDLFAGASGLSEGFIQSGYRPVAHVEMNEHAAKTIETRIAYGRFPLEMVGTSWRNKL